MLLKFQKKIFLLMLERNLEKESFFFKSDLACLSLCEQGWCFKEQSRESCFTTGSDFIVILKEELYFRNILSLQSYVSNKLVTVARKLSNTLDLQCIFIKLLPT